MEKERCSEDSRLDKENRIKKRLKDEELVRMKGGRKRGREKKERNQFPTSIPSNGCLCAEVLTKNNNHT